MSMYRVHVKYAAVHIPTLFLLAYPFVAAAAAPADFSGLVDLLVGMLNTAVIPLIFAIAVLTFMIGVFRYFMTPDSVEKIKEGRNVIIWGVVAIAVMVSIWGLVNALHNTFF